MQIEDLRALYDQDQRFNVQYPDTRREVIDDVIVRHVQISGQKQGWIIWSRLTPDTVDRVIAEQIAYIKDAGHEFEWKVYSYDEPADLKERLIACGFKPEEPADAIMVLDMQALPYSLSLPVPESIRRIAHPDELPALMAVLNEVWDEDFTALGNDLAHQMRHFPDVLSVYAAYVDDHPASVSWVQYPPDSQFAGLWGGSTLPQFRKQGLYTGLLAVRAREAQARGRRFLTVDASPMSRPILERFGFVTIATATACTWEPEA